MDYVLFCAYFSPFLANLWGTRIASLLYEDKTREKEGPMKTLIMAIITLTLFAACAVVPVAPYYGGPYYHGYHGYGYSDRGYGHHGYWR